MLDFIETTTGRKIKSEITSQASPWSGTTNDDRTNYYETIPSTEDNLQSGRRCQILIFARGLNLAPMQKSGSDTGGR